MELTQEDIPLLNSMLKYIVEDNFGSDFVWIDNDFVDKNPIYDRDVSYTGKYYKLMNILIENGIIEFDPNIGWDGKIACGEKARTFLDLNKFQQLYDRQIQTEENRINRYRKLKNETVIVKWNKWTYWWVFGASVIALGLSLYNFFKDL